MAYGIPKAKRATVVADGAAVSGPCRLLGLSAVGGVAAIYDNTSVTAATFLAAILAGDTVWFGPDGIQVTTGVYVDLTAASAVSVYYSLD